MQRQSADRRLPIPGRASVIVLLVLGLSSTPHAAAYAQSVTELTPLQTARTERLLEQRVACRGCHVIGAQGGAIGPVLDGIAERADFEYVLGIIRAPASLPGSLMPHQPMADSDASRLARYIYTRPSAESAATAVESQAPEALPAGAEDDGAALYARHCAACHGDSGEGDGWNAALLPVPPTRHADASLMSERPDDTLFDGIAAGGYVLDRSARMPAFGELLSDQQMRALVSHIRTLCSCVQPAWAGGAR